MKNVQKVSLQGHTVRSVVSVSSKFAIALAIMVGLMAGPLSAKAEDHVSQLTYLQWLVKVSGDTAQFNNSSTAQDYVQWALAKGLSPNGGWKPTHNLDKNALATTLVQYLGLSTKKGGDPIKVLQREGLDLLKALADDEEVTKHALVFVFDDDMFKLRIPGVHSPHKPPHPPHPPKGPKPHPHDNGNGNG